MAAISAVMDKNDAIFSDELNHASIIDGMSFIKSENYSFISILIWKIYVQKQTKQKNQVFTIKLMVITDGVFSMDGDIAKLPEIVEIAEEFDLITYVDDAHGSGVLGKGAGTVKHFGLSDKVDFQIGTLSKAIGVVGGYVAGKQKLNRLVKSSFTSILILNSITTRLMQLHVYEQLK